MSYGRSLALSQNSFVQPPEEEDDDSVDESYETGITRRQATVYDAVAGRLNARGFLSTLPYASKYRDTASSSVNPVRPEEVLFHRQNAPIRYEETDFYFAHEKLPSSCPLPGSELLESIHAYSADFYDHATTDHGQDDSQSMDETALIAMGVLMEEMAKESLGETGDLVLVEGEEVSDNDGRPSLGFKRRVSRKRESSAMASSGDDLESVVRKKRRSKRPRLTPRASTTDMDTELDEKPRIGHVVDG